MALRGLFIQQQKSWRVPLTKNLFKYEAKPEINITESFFNEEDKVREAENILLEASFSEEEIKKAIFESYSNGAPGPDELAFSFYQTFWHLIKDDLCKMFEDFYSGTLDIYRINFATVTLIPKEEGARTMNKFRPISLLNCSYKIFTKVLTNRLNLVVDRLICYNQTTFIKGRYILESVVTAHELLHSIYSRAEPGIVLKLVL